MGDRTRDSFEAALRWFLVVRFFAATALLVLLLVLHVTHESSYDLRGPMALCVASLVINLLWAAWKRSGAALGILAHLQFAVDMAAITVGVLWTGGIASPFTPLFSIVVMSAGLLSRGFAAIHAALSIVAIVAIYVARVQSGDMLAHHDGFMAGAVVLTNVTMVAVTAVVVSFYRVQMQREKDKLRDVSDNLQRAYDEMMAYEQQQREMNQSLQKSMRAKSEFMALMSHELRTPLNSVIGFADLMLDPTVEVDAGERRKFLEHIRRGGKHLLSIIDNIIDLSRVDVGNLQMRLETVDVAQVVEEACRPLRKVAAQRSVRLAETVQEGLPPVVAEPRRVRQILAQLIDNALRFTEGAGSVTVRARRYDGDHFVLLTVTDTGSGIPPEHLDRIFEPFHQVDSSIRREHEGTGLGLALARAFVEVQGGRIWVESKVGEGTTMSFTLPASEASGRITTPGPPREPAAGPAPAK